MPPECRVNWLKCAGALLALAATIGAAVAQPAPQKLRIVGGLAGINQYTRHEEPFWTRTLPALTQGRVTAEIVPFDRAGIRSQEMLRLVAVGTVPFGTALLAAVAAQEPELAAPDLAGLNPDLPALRRSVEAYRPRMQALLRERYGAELLAVYLYPAQVTFCTRPLTGLADLAGRRVRISSPTQADWVSALGGTPVSTPFADIVTNVRSGNIDCAITGTMSGNTIGLHEVTTHLQTTPVSWGLAAFVANSAAWNALDAQTRELLRRELPKLEQAIWDEGARETGEGIACNTGATACTGGRKGRMVEARETEADRARQREVLLKQVLPAWVQRCGPDCVPVWNRSIGAARSLELR